MNWSWRRRFLKGEVLAITGSNGKTTTTTLCGEIFSAAGLQTLVAGNIGLPVIETVEQSKAGAWSVLEVSSFRLETTESFHPRIAMILNITPEHLDRHGTFENYVAMKEKIFANQTGEDYLILNGDDPVVQQAASRARSQVLWFSRSKIVRRGAFLMNGMVVFRHRSRTHRSRSFPCRRFRSKASTISKTYLLLFAPPALRRYRLRSSGVRWHRSMPSSIGWSLSPPSTASTTTTIPGHECGRHGQSDCFLPGKYSPDPGRQGVKTQTTPSSMLCCGRGSRPSTPSARRQRRLKARSPELSPSLARARSMRQSARQRARQ